MYRGGSIDHLICKMFGLCYVCYVSSGKQTKEAEQGLGLCADCVEIELPETVVLPELK